MKGSRWRARPHSSVRVIKPGCFLTGSLGSEATAAAEARKMEFIHSGSHAVSSWLPSNRPWQRGRGDGSARRLCAPDLFFNFPFFPHVFTGSLEAAQIHRRRRRRSCSALHQKANRKKKTPHISLIPLFASRLLFPDRSSGPTFSRISRPIKRLGYFLCDQTLAVMEEIPSPGWEEVWAPGSWWFGASLSPELLPWSSVHNLSWFRINSVVLSQSKSTLLCIEGQYFVTVRQYIFHVSVFYSSRCSHGYFQLLLYYILH